MPLWKRLTRSSVHAARVSRSRPACSLNSKKTAASKRARLPRTADYSRTFLKDWDRLTRSGRYDMNRLKEVMVLLIANDGPLGAEWRDHALGAIEMAIATAMPGAISC